MNPFSAVSWLWRVWRNHSVTFAVLFATTLLGFSVLGGFRQALRGLGAPWYVWLIVPIVAISVCAKKETVWIPELETRKKWSLWIVVGALFLSIAISRLTPDPPASSVGSPPRPGGGRANPHGP